MKNFTLIITFFLGYAFISDVVGTLEIQVEGLNDVTKGSLRFAVFNTEASFLNDDKVYKSLVVRGQGLKTKTYVFDKIPHGEYAVAIYHDINDNGVLDRNLLGIPIEPYAFTQNPSAKWQSPVYEEVKFDLKKEHQVQKVELKKWKDR